MKVPEPLLKLRERAEPIVRDFEWTWTTAVIFSVGLGFFCVVSMAVIPSFWMYFAEQTLGWDGLSGTSDWRPLARDFVAVNLTMGPFVTVVVAAAVMQNWRRKLRGASGERPTGGYR
ncbi:MAG TPA: hypothetical protein VLA90_09900 [Actinomycetota bacterium]|nr:hypothetical protein [Actinomycetota bacterium]